MIANDEGGAMGIEEMRRTEQAIDGYWDDCTCKCMQPRVPRRYGAAALSHRGAESIAQIGDGLV